VHGLPQIVSALTTAGDDDVLAVLNVRARVCTVGDLVHRALLQLENAVFVLWLPATKRFFVSTDGTDSAALASAWSADLGNKLIVKPRIDQVGVNLLWQEVSDTLSTGLSDLLCNDFQKRTCWGLINTGVEYYWSNNGQTDLGFAIDQIAGEVAFGALTGEGESAMETFTATGQTICLKLEPTKSKLIFE
jgi:hypothetical protein